MSIADVLEQSAVETPPESKPKVRKPKKAPETDGPAEAPKPKKARKPKMIEKLDEEGNPVLDENGEPVMVEAPKRVRKSVPLLESQTLTITEKGKKAKYRAGTKRNAMFASIRDGMTVGQFYEANGGKKVAHTFLVWFIGDAGVVEAGGNEPS